MNDYRGIHEAKKEDLFTKKNILIGIGAIIIIIIVVLFAITLIKYKDLRANSIRLPGNLTEQEQSNLETFYNVNKDSNDLAYQKKYPNLYVKDGYNFKKDEDKKICYLTFDDGPNPNLTPGILDTLKKKGAKATFFVIYSDNEENIKLYKRIVDEGHTIAIHTASHKYDEIYSSIDAYLEDFNKLSEHIEKQTGVHPEIFRFPGGSVNGMNQGIALQLYSEMARRGYAFYDWTCSVGDAAESAMPSTSKMVKNATSTDENKKILLMHDGKGHAATADALPSIIDALKEKGYSFAPLTKDVKPVTFANF